MAGKKNKKPKHTNLVLPSDKKRKKDKHKKEEHAPHTAALRRDGAGEKEHLAVPSPPVPAAQDAAGTQAGAQAGDGGATVRPAHRPQNERPAPQGRPALTADALEELPPNAIRMPRPKKSKASPAKRKRRRRRLRILLLAVVACLAVFVFSNGMHLILGAWVSDLYEGIRIAARPGDGFPIDFSVPGYLAAQPMGDSGFAVLGEQEMAMVSSTGTPLRRIQHGYLSPGFSAGKTRVVVYSRGGTSYVVESRGKTVAQRDTDQNIQFCSMSPDGWLAVVTSSRYRGTLNVYSPLYDTGDPQFQMPLVDETPLMLSFHSDNRAMALGCISAKDGAMGSTIHLLRTDRDSIQASIREENAVLLRLEYTAGGKVLGIFDTFAALYNAKGEQMARCEFGQRSLLAADVAENRVALVFGSSTQGTATLMVLNDGLEDLYEVSFENRDTPKVLVSRAGAWVATGQRVLAFGSTGQALPALELEVKTLGLVHGGQPLALVTGSALPLSGVQQAQSGTSAPVSASAPGSVALPPASGEGASLPENSAQDANAPENSGNLNSEATSD